MFRGYIKLNGKRAVEPFKNVSKLKTYDEIRECEDFAGVLSKDTILLDFDDQVQAEKALKIVKDLELNCVVYETDRGYHIFFKNKVVDKCATATRLACGLRADIKVGKKPSYAVFKRNGVERQCVYVTNHMDEVPDFFTPMDSTIEFLNMAEGGTTVILGWPQSLGFSLRCYGNTWNKLFCQRNI